MKKIILILLSAVVLTQTINAQIQKGSTLFGEGAGDSSGASTSLSSDGNTVAIGASTNDNGSGVDAGHVRVRTWNGIAWGQKGLDIDGEAAGDNSGQSVSISADGNTVAVGAHNNSGMGHVRIYLWNGAAWVQKGLDIDGEAAGDYSGQSVSISADGNTVAIGAPNNSGMGHVRVYLWTGTVWVQKGIDVDGIFSGGGSGMSVSISADGNTVAFGTPAAFAGFVSVYNWSGSAWVQMGVDLYGLNSGDYFGNAISLSSDGLTIVVGAPGYTGGTYAGLVQVYYWNGTLWIQKGADLYGIAGASMGISVSINSAGNTIAVGSNNLVQLYSWSGSTWAQIGSDVSVSGCVGWGESVKLSADGNTLAIGDPCNSYTKVYGQFTTGIINVLNSDVLSIYPNPFNEQIVLGYQPKEKGWIELYNVLGEKVYSQQITNSTTTINLTNQPNGVYFIRITDGNEVFTRKLIKQ